MKAFDLSSLKVMVIDDQRFSLSLMREILRIFNCRGVYVADDVQAAIKMSDTVNPDIIFCDYEMSPISGIDFTRMIRAGKSNWDSRVPVVMLTSHSEFNHVIAECDTGSTFCLAKPISATSVYRQIHDIILQPRSFIKCSTYTGPDRRNPDASSGLMIGDRRAQAAQIEEHPDVTLSMEERAALLLA